MRVPAAPPIVALTAVVLLAGCSPSSTTPTATAATTSGATPSAGPTDEPTPPTAPPTVEESPEPTPGPTTDASVDDVDVVLTFAGWNSLTSSVEVGAYVAVVESDGTCTLTLTGEGGTESVTVDAAPDASSTSCGALTLARSALSAGTWTATVGYASSSSAGTSAPVTVEVP